MTKRKALIESLIHFHHKTSPKRGWWDPKAKTVQKLRSKIAEPDQYKSTTSL